MHRFIEFGRGKSIPLTPEYANSNLPNEISNTGRVIVKKHISKIDKNEQITNYNSDKHNNKTLEERRYIIDKNGKIVERKTKVRLHSLGGYDPPKKGNRGRLDRLKTVGTFDLGNEMSVLSAVARNLNEQIINTQMTSFTMFQPQLVMAVAGGLDVTSSDQNNSNNDNISSNNNNGAQETRNSQIFSSLSTPSRVRHSSSNSTVKIFGSEAVKLDLSSELSSSCSNSILVNRGNSVSPNAAKTKEKRIKYYEDTTLNFLSPYEKKVRSLSTGSCIFKKSKNITDNRFASLDIKKFTSNDEISTSTSRTNFTLSLGPQKETSNRLDERNSSNEEVTKVDETRAARTADNDDMNFKTTTRKPILRKSKRITRTDSEFMCDNVLQEQSEGKEERNAKIDVHIENLCGKTDSFESDGGKYREGSSDIDDIVSPREMYKSTDESSRNISTDDLDTVFSDKTDLEQLEKEYKEHMRTNLQRVYRSDGDNLDEIGRKRNEFCQWKNQSFENELDFFDDDDEDLRNKRRSEDEHEKSIENDLEIENISNYSSDQIESSLDKAEEEEEDNKDEFKEEIEKIEEIASPKGSVDDKQPQQKDDIKKPEKGKIREQSHRLFSEGSLTNLFEKRFGKFKKMNKLLKCKRFSTSALYDRNKNQQTSKESIFSSSKSSEKADEKSLGSKPKSSPSKSNIFGSKHSICSTKSFFGSKTSKGFTFRGKKYLFSDSKSSDSKSSDESNTKYRSSPSRYNSKKHGRNGTSEPPPDRCGSPLSEAFYNPTGSVRLSAMELFEKFCSQDFGGLYKHETYKNDERFEDGASTFTESHHLYQQNTHKNLGAIKKYNNSRNAKLLRQKSEPKFSSRHDVYYENSPNYGMYYHQEEDENYYDEEDENNLQEYQYSQAQGEYYDEYGLVPRRYGDYYDDEYEEDDAVVGPIQDVYYEEDDENFIADKYREEDEEEAEGDDDDDDIKNLYISPNAIYKESTRQSETTDSDVDEIFLMPGKIENYNNYQLQNKNFLIQQTFFKPDDLELLESSNTNLKSVACGGEAEDAIGNSSGLTGFNVPTAGGGYEVKDTLTIYRISSKDNILDGPSLSEGDDTGSANIEQRECDNLEEDMSGGDKPEESSLENALNQYIKDVPTDISLNIDSKLDPFFIKSDIINLDRTESIELLSNSSGTMRSNSTITEYAFDTVRNLHLDSCSTSKLSLSLKSEVFDDFNLSPDEIKPMKNYDIEDFTLTPDESISETDMMATREEAPIRDAIDEPGSDNDDYVEIVNKFLEKELRKHDVEIGIDAAAETDAEIIASMTETDTDAGEPSGPSVDNLPIVQIERQTSSELDPSQSIDESSKYTIIDLDEVSSIADSYGLDGENTTGISAFTNELTKEFDILFSRAQLRTDEAESEPEPVTEDNAGHNSNNLSAFDNTGSLPSRHSMQKLEPIALKELEEMAAASSTVAAAAAAIAVATTASAMSGPTTSGIGSVSVDGEEKEINKLKLDEIKVNVDKLQIDKKTNALNVTNDEKKNNCLALKKIRSQSLGNLNKKTKCFPL